MRLSEEGSLACGSEHARFAASEWLDMSVKNVAARFASFALNQTHGFAKIAMTILSGKLQWRLSRGQIRLNYFCWV